MMKFALVLVMLQICYCFVIDLNRNKEMIKSLRNLKSGDNIKCPMSVPVPGPYMLKNPACCVHTFSKNLQDVLRNLTINGTKETDRKNLRENLKNLGEELNDHRNCTMGTVRTRGKSFTWINKYIKFLQELNNSSFIC